jgi:hypothetical protein
MQRFPANTLQIVTLRRAHGALHQAMRCSASAILLGNIESWYLMLFPGRDAAAAASRLG